MYNLNRDKENSHPLAKHITIELWNNCIVTYFWNLNNNYNKILSDNKVKSTLFFHLSNAFYSRRFCTVNAK